MAIHFDENGKFEAWPREKWATYPHFEKCVQCKEYAAVYRIEFDDQLCVNCGDTHSYGTEEQRSEVHGKYQIRSGAVHRVNCQKAANVQHRRNGISCRASEMCQNI